MMNAYTGDMFHNTESHTSQQANSDELSNLYYQGVREQIYAGFGIRLVSFIIDVLIIHGLQRLILAPLNHFTHIPDWKLWINYFSVDHLVKALIFYLYFVLLTKCFKQTLGKMICNIRVERVDREALRWSDVLFREWLGRIVSGVMLCLPYVVVLFTPQHRGIHDYFGDTVVIKNKYAKLFFLKK
ncbi:RDD family protein [Staphylococcus argensis]|uniref:RDD family protein n=1 Tax=Staphylococcus argensis TaxID=1607738 RepID=UPI002283F03D|nr:RDD family protein [Staphylococcus argensis]MCY6990712.1 RDD family protein [Staphylococcus argensis]